MLNYWFLYDKTTGIIYPSICDQAPASSSMGVLGPYPQDTASSTVVMAYTYPSRFLAQGSPVALVEQPYFTLDQSGNTITATLNNAPSTPPTSCTFTVCGQTFTETITNGQATLTLNIHSAISGQQFNVSCSATGCASAILGVGTAASSTTIQAYQPSGQSTVYIAPTSKVYLQSFYALSPASLEMLLADIGTAVSLLSDINYRKMSAALRIINNLYSWATKLASGAYVPTTQDATDIQNVEFTTNESNALTDIETNLIPNLFTTLSNAYPSGGTKQLQYADYVTDLGKSFKAYEQYMSDLQSIPNLV